jgi:DNA-binding transcriptional MerR regulator
VNDKRRSKTNANQSEHASPVMSPVMSIGQFAARTGLSVPTLRFYASEGLLEPARVDPNTNYRQYTPDQLELAERIRLLRELEMGLPDIRLVLQGDLQHATGLLERHDATLRNRYLAQRGTLERMREILRGKRQVRDLKVFEEWLPAQWILSYRQSMRWDGFEEFSHESKKHVMEALNHHRVQPSGTPFVLQHHLGVVPELLDIEVCIPVPEPLLGFGAMRGGSLEPMRLMLMHLPGKRFVGLDTYEELMFWLESKGFGLGDAAVWREAADGIEIGYTIRNGPETLEHPVTMNSS